MMLGVILAIAAGGHTEAQAERKRTKLTIQAAFPLTFPVLGTSAKRFAAEIERRSDSDIKVKMLPAGSIVSAFEILDAVSKGVLDAGWSMSAYWEGKIPGISLFCQMPFSWSAREHYAWIRKGGGLALYEEIYAKHRFNVKPIPAVMTGPEGFGWFMRPINDISDLRGLKMRSTGFDGKWLSKLGVSVVNMPGGEIIPALERGVIDAVNLFTPNFDKQLGLHKIAKYYYYPSAHQPFSMLELIINRDTWNRMSPFQQQLIEQVCHETVLWGIAEDERLTPPALDEFRRHGVTVRNVPDSITAAGKRAWDDVARGLSSKNPDFAQVYAAVKAYRPSTTMIANTKKTQPAQNAINTDRQKSAVLSLEPIDEEYIAIKKSNIREQANVMSARVGSLQKGQVVTALGKVKGKKWIFIARDGKHLGYVYDSLIVPVDEATIPPPKKPAAAIASAQATTPVKPLKLAAVPKNVDFGKYRALVIGNNNYRTVPKLRAAVPDARAVAKMLRRLYDFEVTLLINATRGDIIEALDGLRSRLTRHENMLIYYAGHGYYDKEADRGYWLPVDAHHDRRTNWVSNATITDTLKSMRAKHVIVIADSCYSGTLTRGFGIILRSPDYYGRMARKRSRTVLTSGGIEPVNDAGGGQNSVFCKVFLTALSGNTGIMDGTQLFTKVRRPVMMNAPQTPQYSDIRFTGHEGGDFFFVRRK